MPRNKPTNPPPFPTVLEYLFWRGDPNPEGWMVINHHGRWLDAATTRCIPRRRRHLFLVRINTRICVQRLKWHYRAKWCTKTIVYTKIWRHLDDQMQQLTGKLPAAAITAIQKSIEQKHALN